MNIFEIQSTSAVKSVSASPNVPNVATSAKLANEDVSLRQDYYSSTTANDAVVAKVIALSINRSFGNERAANEVATLPNTKRDATAKLNDKFGAQESENYSSVPNFETVTANVVSFVENALANLAKRGFDKEQLSFFKNEAISGVEVGIDQAKLELVGIANDDLYKAIDKTKKSIIGGIHQLPVEPFEYERIIKNIEKVETGTQRELAAIKVTTLNQDTAKIDFEARAFNAVKNESNRSLFTTSSSNISFAIQGELAQSSRNDVAKLINKVDGLATSFYRNDIESAYRKTKELGFSDKDIVALANQLNKADKSNQMKMYGDIQHLQINSNESDYSGPKSVAEYVNKYLDVMETTKSTLHEERDFNQVINGLVNQMKDVQVPDLLQAINRFHAFNKRFN